MQLYAQSGLQIRNSKSTIRNTASAVKKRGGPLRDRPETTANPFARSHAASWLSCRLATGQPTAVSTDVLPPTKPKAHVVTYGKKAELKRRGIGYRELAEKLTAMGIPETERNIANKISRGGFTAVFFVQCLEAIGAKEIRIG